MLRLIFVTSSLSHGGAERHAITLMNRLAQRGHDCHAVYIKSGADQLDRIRLREADKVRCLAAARYFDLRALSDFAGHLSRIAPAAIVAANPYSLMYASLALRLARLRAPLAVTFHSSGLLGLKEHVKMLLERPFFWMADCAVFVCEKQKRYWLPRAVLARRNEVIHNGVDTEHFQDRWIPQIRAKLRGALGFSDADYVIGLSAVLRPEKNHLQLVEAVAMLRARGIPAKALMIGDGEMRGAIEARARELGVDGHVVITGLQQDVRPYVAASDVMVLCSTTETFSLAAIEAMALRKPVVLSEVGGASEMIQPGWNGFLFPAGDTKAFVERLAILADREVAATAGRNARETVEGLFSERAMVDRYEQLLLGLCGLRARNPGRTERRGEDPSVTGAA